MPYTADNIEINIANGTAILATDYGTSGYGLTAAHAQIAKVVWGDENVSYRTNETYPFPVRVYGGTGSALDVSGTIAGTGDFYVRTNPTIPLIVKGSTFTADAPVGITGRIQGMTNGTAVGVTGYINVLNSVSIYGISGGTAIAVTGGRRLNSSTDSVAVSGTVGIAGLSLSAASHSISVYGSDLGNKVLTKIYGSDGTTLGMSGDALKVALVNSGINFSVSMGSIVGITNASEGPIRIQGYTASGTPVTIKGQLAGGAVEVAATSAVPVGVCGSVVIVDTNIVNSLESSAKPLISNLSTINANTTNIQTISNQLTSAVGANVTVREIKRPSAILHGQKDVTSTPTSLASGVLKVGVTLKSLRTNSGPIYVGNSANLSVDNGYVLDPGDSVFLETDDLKKIFVRVSPDSTSKKISYIAS